MDPRQAFQARTGPGPVFEVAANATCERCRRPFMTTLLVGVGTGRDNRGGSVGGVAIEAIELRCTSCREASSR